MSRSSQRILEWETACIDNATVLLAWMPFGDALQGLTTRAEVSRAIAQKRQRLVIGMPADAGVTGHIRYHAHQAGIPIRTSLEECMLAAIGAAGA